MKSIKILMISGGDINNITGGYLVRVSNIYKCMKLITNNVVLLQYPIFSDPIDKGYKNIIVLRASKNYIFLGLKIIIDSFRLIKTIKENDILIIEGSLFLPFAIVGKLLNKKILYDSHGFIGMIDIKYKGIKKLKSIKSFILRKIIGQTLDYLSLKISDYSIAISSTDKEFAAKKYHIDEDKILILPHVIPLEDSKYEYSTRGKGEYWIFVGDLYSIQNYDSVLNIINIAKKMPQEKFVIVGRGSEKFRDYPPNIVFTGFVKDIEEYYEKAKGCLIPMFTGTGIKTKVLECLKFGRGIITTPVGVQGLDNIDKIKDCGVIVLNKLDELINSLIDFKSIKVDSECLRKYLKENFSFETMCSILKQVISNL
ncbi:glycosyltransferase [Metallosphaera sp. D4-4]|uniref:glycosyltransferase n=1 Tax=Metallosphaera sp. D4-4 TaxID=3379815 RepID=UPI00390898E1